MAGRRNRGGRRVNGWNPLTWYEENKNNVTVIEDGRLVVTDGSTQTSSSTSTSTSDETSDSPEPAAPAEPAEEAPTTYTVAGVTYDAETGRPVDAPEGGYSVESDGSITPHDRVSPSGIYQRGIDMSAINSLYASLASEGKMTAGDLGEADSVFSKVLKKNNTDDTDTDTDTSETADTDNSETADTDTDLTVTENNQGNEENSSATVPNTTGQGDDPQDGASSQPDIAESVRTVRMNRNGGPARDPRNRGNRPVETPVVEEEPNPNALTPTRLAARSAFLDPNNKGYNAIRARDRAVGAADQNGVGGMNVDGEFVAFNPGMSADARFELAGGKIDTEEEAQAFLEKYTNKITNPDESTDDEE